MEDSNLKDGLHRHTRTGSGKKFSLFRPILKDTIPKRGTTSQPKKKGPKEVQPARLKAAFRP
ncbi:MAG: hypothetical protein OEW12_04820, partial [Deltaproteobacteria bacterium]|nr:hypothetical protein [Deltaproteobacteria bacterium]